MNYQMLDYLEKIIAQDFVADNALLEQEGVLSSDGQMVLNKINLMAGAYASNIADRIQEADMNLQEVIAHLEQMKEQNQYMGIYYFLLYLFAASEMPIPYLFMQLSGHTQVLQYYMNELIADLKDCYMDEKD